MVPNQAQTTGSAYVNSALCRAGLSAAPATGCSLVGTSCGGGRGASLSLSDVSVMTGVSPVSVCGGMTMPRSVSGPTRPRTLTLLVAGESMMDGMIGASVTGRGCGAISSGSRSVCSSSASGGLSPEPGN